MAGERGLADVVTLQRRKAAEISEGDEESFFLDTVAEYQWARDAAGLAPATLDGLTRPIIEVCQHYGVAPWRLTPRQVDKYFAGAGKRASATVRRKMNQIDGYFAFLEQRYAGEIARRYGVAVESPVDLFNRPRHRGDFGLRVPPSQRAVREFFTRWRESLEPARKPAVARRDYVMACFRVSSGWVKAVPGCPGLPARCAAGPRTNGGRRLALDRLAGSVSGADQVLEVPGSGGRQGAPSDSAWRSYRGWR